MNYIILDTNIIGKIENIKKKISKKFEFITLAEVATKIDNASDENVFFYITNHDNINSYGTLKLGENQKAHLDLFPKTWNNTLDINSMIGWRGTIAPSIKTSSTRCCLGIFKRKENSQPLLQSQNQYPFVIIRAIKQEKIEIFLSDLERILQFECKLSQDIVSGCNTN